MTCVDLMCNRDEESLIKLSRCPVRLVLFRAWRRWLTDDEGAAAESRLAARPQTTSSR